MKYLEYIAILLWTIIRKPLGLVWIYVAIPFRKYARNTVYNYVLQNGIYLPRLLERPMEVHADYWMILPYHRTDGGYIKKRKVSWIEYKLVYWLIWGWLDDDSNEDTYAWKHTQKLRGEWEWFAKATEGLEQPYYGNSFDLGDKRAEYPAYNFWTTTAWTWRNTAYNFRYMQWEKKAGDPNIWLWEAPVFNWKFGWLSDAHKGNPYNYSLVAFGWK